MSSKITLWVALNLCLLSLLTGCEPIHHYNRLEVVTFTGPEKARKVDRKPYGTVRPYEKPEDVGHPFEVIGFLTCEGSAEEENGILKAMLYRAADMGADGVLLVAPRIGSENVAGGNLDFKSGWVAPLGMGDRRAYRAQAIRSK